MKLRSFIFWPHLVTAVSVGLVILIMSVTGVLLTYERQMLAWADSRFSSTIPSSGATPLPIEDLLAGLRRSQPDLTPASLTIRSHPEAAVSVTAGQRTVYVDRYSGALLGESSRTGIRALMTEIRAWHRWLAIDGDRRSLARGITGWSNAIFLFIVLSGIYLWFPRKWSWPQVRNVVLFNRGARGKARDFNWHNVIGSWCAIPLLIVVTCALPISFGWFNALVYRAVGEAPPPAGGGRGAESRPRAAQNRTEAAETPASSPLRVDSMFGRATALVPAWRSIALRLPTSPTAPAVLTIDTGDGGQPHRRSTLTLDATTADVVRYETFSDLTLGRRIRNTMRFAHTGEVLGIPGQTIAGIASAGGAVLVWTGFALAWRRFRAWVNRRRRPEMSRVQSAA